MSIIPFIPWLIPIGMLSIILVFFCRAIIPFDFIVNRLKRRKKANYLSDKYYYPKKD